ncbi:MAG TPA: hemerythrin domain-containing protein [Chloroflexia bacterium]|nr:hemerythrin domain-containing protein [Chloroflexia bacterium]
MTQTGVTENKFIMDGFFMIHRAIRKDATAFEQAAGNLSSPAQAAQLARWFQFFWSMVEIHHTGEDELVYPQLSARSSLFAAEEADLSAQHVKLHDYVDRLGQLLKQMEQAQDLSQKVELRYLAVEFNTFMNSHLQQEENVFVPEIARHFSVKEQQQIEKQLQKKTPLKEVALALPWIASGLDETERAKLLSELPWLFRFLYRVSWKKKYEQLVAVFQLPGAEMVASK